MGFSLRFPSPLQCLAVYAGISVIAVAGSETDRVASWEEAAQTAGIDKQLVADPTRRPELVQAVQRRIMQGVFEENAFRIELARRDPSKSEYGKLVEPYLNSRAKGFDRALSLASEFRCVELIPLLIKHGDMKVLNFGATYQKGEEARAVQAMAGMGLKAADPLFVIIERSPNWRERYYALCALQLGMTAWKDELGTKGLAERMTERCDTSKPTVQLALALLNGNLHDPKTAAGEDLDQRSK